MFRGSSRHDRAHGYPPAAAEVSGSRTRHSGPAQRGAVYETTRLLAPHAGKGPLAVRDGFPPTCASSAALGSAGSSGPVARPTAHGPRVGTERERSVLVQLAQTRARARSRRAPAASRGSSRGPHPIRPRARGPGRTSGETSRPKRGRSQQHNVYLRVSAGVPPPSELGQHLPSLQMPGTHRYTIARFPPRCTTMIRGIRKRTTRNTKAFKGRAAHLNPVQNLSGGHPKLVDNRAGNSTLLPAYRH